MVSTEGRCQAGSALRIGAFFEAHYAWVRNRHESSKEPRGRAARRDGRRRAHFVGLPAARNCAHVGPSKNASTTPRRANISTPNDAGFQLWWCPSRRRFATEVHQLDVGEEACGRSIAADRKRGWLGDRVARRKQNVSPKGTLWDSVRVVAKHRERSVTRAAFGTVSTRDRGTKASLMACIRALPSCVSPARKAYGLMFHSG